MGILSRIFKVGQAEANQLIDKMERPEKMLDQAIRDREKQIAASREAIVKVIATEKQVKAQLDSSLRSQQEWESKAELALRSGKEGLAEQALVRSEEYGKEASCYQQQWEGQHVASSKLKQGLAEIENDFAALKRERSLIVAQSKAADAKKDIVNARAKIGRSNTSDLIERMRAKAQQSSFEADAASELVEGSAVDSLEKEFASLESEKCSASVTSKLDAMKDRLKCSV